jgi:hypothetical protein
MDGRGRVGQHRPMLRRIGLAGLWFFAAWTAGATVALVLDLGAWVAPTLAVTAAAAIFWALGRAGSTAVMADASASSAPSIGG